MPNAEGGGLSPEGTLLSPVAVNEMAELESCDRMGCHEPNAAGGRLSLSLETEEDKEDDEREKT